MDRAFVSEIAKVFGTRKNGQQIKKFIQDNQDAISGFNFDVLFDFIIDEEGVDALVEMGGNPSNLDIQDLESIAGKSGLNVFDICRIVVRCLYHGAHFEEGVVEDIQLYKESVLSCRVSMSLYQRCKRSVKYLNTEKERLQFWAKYKPEFYTRDDGSTTDSNGYYHFGDRDSTTVFASNGKQVDRLYMVSTRSDKQWMEDEREFGKYDRTHRILVSCIRNANKGFSRQVKKFKTVEDDNKTLKSFMLALDLNLAKSVIRFL